MSRRQNSRDDDDSISKGILFAAVVALFVIPFAILTYFVVEHERAIKDHEGRIARLEQKVADCVDCSLRVQVKDRGGYVWNTYHSEDEGEGGQGAFAVDIDILSEQYRWRCASATVIVKENDENRTYDLGDIIRKYSPENELKDAKAVVVVGTASSEGTQATQENLAANRMETLYNIVQPNLQKTLPIYGMNFGQYTGGETSVKCSPDTAAQRRVLIVKVTEQKEGISPKEFSESLKRRFVALAENSVLRFPIDIRKYTMYQKGADMLAFGRKNER
ncbi:MAG TPA: hypothetical protein VGN95_10980 [Pyrinomonadaceae bacterium]|jgi:hypothetical protein|nr:hypothetical protein [Pyrinomonadaceae bacterium]